MTCYVRLFSVLMKSRVRLVYMCLSRSRHHSDVASSRILSHTKLQDKETTCAIRPQRYFQSSSLSRPPPHQSEVLCQTPPCQDKTAHKSQHSDRNYDQYCNRRLRLDREKPLQPESYEQRLMGHGTDEKKPHTCHRSNTCTHRSQKQPPETL